MLHVGLIDLYLVMHIASARIINTWTTYRNIDRYISIYDFLAVMFSVGLASAHPN